MFTTYKMCGIVGYLGSQPAFPKIYTSLKLLMNRGYDSAGICTIKEIKENHCDIHKLVVHKKASTIEYSGMEMLLRFSRDHEVNTIGIGHTRWATHGAKTDANAHPHVDSNSDFAVVHNGIIENYNQIRKKLELDGITLLSQTDTEVIPKLLQYHLRIELEARKVDTLSCDEFEKHVFMKTISELSGTWAILVVSTLYPNKIFVSKNGSPLVIGLDKKFVLLCSEQLPLSSYFNDFITLKDNDNILVEKDEDGDISIRSIKSIKIDHNNLVSFDIIHIENRLVDSSPTPYKHWMIKEIFEQPESISRCLNMGGRILDSSQVKLGGIELKRDELISCDHIIFLGCGTSLNAAQIGGKMMKKLSCFTSVSVIDASEFLLSDIPNGKTAFVFLSQSGETKDLHRCLPQVKALDFPIIGIINVVGSLIARESTCGIYLNAGREVAVGSTKSFTSQVVALSLLSIWFSQNRRTCSNTRIETLNCLRTLSNDVKMYLTSRNRCQLQSIAKTLSRTKTIFVLGKDEFRYVADEAALKIKEIAYIHAEAHATGSLKHGPFAMIDNETVVMIISPMDHHFNKTMNTIQELHSRSARIILITNENNDELSIHNNELIKFVEHLIMLPANTCFQSVLSIVPIQILSYEIALLKEHNPDFPKNLAKVVTVDG